MQSPRESGRRDARLLQRVLPPHGSVDYLLMQYTRFSDTTSQTPDSRMPRNDGDHAQWAMEIEGVACAHCAAGSAEP
jgi:hypothetical protein